MSRERMNQLLVGLQTAGWSLLDFDEFPMGSREPFVLEDEEIVWAIRRADGLVLELEFHAFEDLGRRTSKLRDILYCVERKSREKLYFTKIGSRAWATDMPRFVSLLSDR